jgi:hypothetical protein
MEGFVRKLAGSHSARRNSFLISSGILLVERDKPDVLGARKVMVAYGAIAAVKIASPMELARFQVMGFQSPF